MTQTTAFTWHAWGNQWFERLMRIVEGCPVRPMVRLIADDVPSWSALRSRLKLLEPRASVLLRPASETWMRASTVAQLEQRFDTALGELLDLVDIWECAIGLSRATSTADTRKAYSAIALCDLNRADTCASWDLPKNFKHAQVVETLAAAPLPPVTLALLRESIEGIDGWASPIQWKAAAAVLLDGKRSDWGGVDDAGGGHGELQDHLGRLSMAFHTVQNPRWIGFGGYLEAERYFGAKDTLTSATFSRWRREFFG